MAKTAGDVIVETLMQWGVHTVFGFPGDGVDGVIEAFRKNMEKIRFIQVRHEEAAAFAACHSHQGVRASFPVHLRTPACTRRSTIDD